MEAVCHRVTKQIMLAIFRTKQSRYSMAKERALLFSTDIFLSSANKKNRKFSFNLVESEHQE